MRSYTSLLTGEKIEITARGNAVAWAIVRPSERPQAPIAPQANVQVQK